MVYVDSIIFYLNIQLLILQTNSLIDIFDIMTNHLLKNKTKHQSIDYY